MPNLILARLRRVFQRWLESELIRRVLKNSGYLFSSTGLVSAIGMLQGILAARLLGVAGFGILGTITMFTNVINEFTSFRMGELVIKYVGYYTETGERQKAAAVFKAAALAEIGASFLAFVLIWALSPLGARYLAKDVQYAHWFAIYGLIVLANLISESSTGLLQIFDRFRPLAVLYVAQGSFALLIILSAYIRQGGLGDILVAYILGKTLGAVGLTVVAMLEATRRWGWGWWLTPLRLLKDNVREMLRFAISTNISASLTLITKDSEVLWVSFLRNPVEVGYYKLALSLMSIIQLPINPLSQATYPELSRETARRNWSNVRYLLQQGSILAGGYTMSASLFLAILGQPLIRYVYKPEYLPAYPALLILLLGCLVSNAVYWRRLILLAFGLADYLTKVNFVVAVLKVVGVLLLVPVFGYLGSASLLSGYYLLVSGITMHKALTTLRTYQSTAESEAALSPVSKSPAGDSG
jgi:O-antigen/teichoic acid export membrane protein